MESKLENGQCGFRPGRSTTDQIFTLRQIFEKSWEYTKDALHALLIWKRHMTAFLEISSGECCIDGHLLMAIKSLYCQLELCVCVNGKQSKSFQVGVGFRQGCVLSHFFFIIYMNWMDKFSRTDGCVMIERCNINRLLLADDLVLLASSEFGLQLAFK